MSISSMTISYGRYGDGIQPAVDVNTTECDLCMSTLYVKPDASTIFEHCSGRVSKRPLPIVNVAHISIFVNTEGYTTSVFGNNFTKTSQLHGFTSNGMMCMCL